MGANVSSEQMEHVNAYRATVLTMMNYVLEHSALDEADAHHCQKLAHGRDQVEMLSDVMLVELAKVWYAAFWSLWADNSTNQLSNEAFLDRFRALRPELPAGCSSDDVCAVMKSLDASKQLCVIEMFSEGMQHVSDARLTMDEI